MVSEKVDVQLALSSPKVRCEFVFKNEGPATTVKMGFPEGYGGVDMDWRDKTAFGSFRSWVDGKAAKTKFVPGDPQGHGDYQAWHVKDVHFGAGQTRTVVNEYESGFGYDSMGGISFAYVLRTGASWKGKIGQARITVDVSGVPSHYSISLSPQGYHKEGDVVTWVLRDFEPNEDIGVYMMPKRLTLNGDIYIGMWSTYRIVDGAAIAKLRFLQEAGGSLEYDSKHRACTVNYGSRALKLTADSRTAVLNGSEKTTLPLAPTLKAGRLIVPIAAVVRALGGSATFDKENCQVHLFLKPAK